MKVFVDCVEMDLDEEEIEDRHIDGNCIDDCPHCAWEDFTLERHREQQADLRHSSGEDCGLDFSGVAE